MKVLVTGGAGFVGSHMEYVRSFGRYLTERRVLYQRKAWCTTWPRAERLRYRVSTIVRLCFPDFGADSYVVPAKLAGRLRVQPAGFRQTLPRRLVQHGPEEPGDLVTAMAAPRC